MNDRSRGAARRGRDAPRRTELPPRDDQVSRDRRASAEDRDHQLYARKRRTQARQRARIDRAAYEPGGPDPDVDWTLPQDDGDGLVRVPPPSLIGETIEQLRRSKGWGERLTGASAAQRWEEIVGPELAGRCEPVRLAGRLLIVRAESQVWATQLRYLLPQLRSRANEVLGAGRVEEVRLVIGPLEGRGEV